MSESTPADDDTPADAVLAEYLDRADRGETLDRERFCQEHPEEAEELRAYFHSLETIHRALGDTRSRPARAAEAPGGEFPRDFGSYVLLEKLGAGGMGDVYKAEHRRMERVVALKTLRREALDSPEAIERFHREVRAAAKLSHPNIVTAYDAGEVEGVHFLAMEFVDGCDLHSLVARSGPLAVAQAVDYVIQAARGLEFAHQKQVIHRDVKPANLLLDRAGIVKLLDLGLARLETPVSGLVPTGSGSLTHFGQIMGTIDFMPPEQALDTKRAGAPADIYSLGCTLFFLLTRRMVYPAGTPMERIVAHREQPIPSLWALRSDVPERLDAVLRHMVAKRPEDRPASMTEVIQKLEAALPADARKAGPWPFPSPQAGQPARADSAAANVPTPTKAGDSPRSAGPQVEATSDWSAQVPAQSQPRRRRTILVATLAAAALAAAAWAVVIKLQTRDGTLVLTLNEPGVQVKVFDEAGNVEVDRPGEQGVLRISVDPGKHRLKVEKEGFQFYTEEFTIESRGTKELEARLEPLRPPVASTTRAGQLPALAIAPFTPEEARKHQERWAKHLGVPIEYENSIGMRFMLIPPGEFDMGSTEEEVAKLLEEAKAKNDDSWYIGLLPSQAPKHRVRITKPFWLGRHEVTRGQFRRFVADRGYRTEVEQDGKGGSSLVNGQLVQDPQFVWNADLGVEQADDHPVVHVSWNDVTAFCVWLSEKEGETSHLPSEAQWEHACRAGTTTTWNSGNDERALKEHAWFGVGSGGKAHPVGQKTPNAWGLYDMHGSVAEWCQDFWGERYYSTSPVDDPTGEAGVSDRVNRDGGWNFRAVNCQSASRNRLPTEYRDYVLGFRVARSVSIRESGAASPQKSGTESPQSKDRPTPKPSAPATTATLEVHFQRAGQQGSYQVLEADALPLYSGDRIQIHAKLPEPMAAYVVALSSSGGSSIVYDSAADGGGLVREVHVPAKPDQWLPLEPPGGTETLVLLARETPLERPEELLEQCRVSGPPPAFDELALLVADETGPRIKKASEAVVRSRGLGKTPVSAEKGFLQTLLAAAPGRWPVVRAISFPHRSPPASSKK